MSFKIKSLQPDKISDEELKHKGATTVSLMSFERAISQDAELSELRYGKKGRSEESPLGYRVTEQGIEIIWS